MDNHIQHTVWNILVFIGIYRYLKVNTDTQSLDDHMQHKVCYMQIFTVIYWYLGVYTDIPFFNVKYSLQSAINRFIMVFTGKYI